MENVLHEGTLLLVRIISISRNTGPSARCWYVSSLHVPRTVFVLVYILAEATSWNKGRR